MATAGLYRRALPCPPAVEFASPLGKSLFREALECGTMEVFFKLISYYQTQSEPAYCGLASLSMVLNALSIDPGRTWKGPWRWFDDTMLDCCEPLSKIKNDGITFEKVACLAICNGANVKASRSNTSTIDEFRNIVISCASSQDCHVIVSYHRGALKQTGTGHFSPIGGYHTERDMVLILDVARFKYPPHWVPLTCLWEGMNTVDETTGKYRGYMIISRQQNGPSVLYSMSCKNWNWSSAAKYLVDDVPVLLKSEDLRDVHEVLSVVYKAAPVDLKDLITWVAEVRRQEDGTNTLSEEEKGRLAIKEDILRQVRETEIFEHVTKWLVSELACYKNNASLGNKITLAEIAAEVCCQGAEFLSGKLGLQDGIFCRGADVKHVKADRRETKNVVSGTVIQDGSKQGVDMLVPLCQTNSSRSCGILQNCCNPMHPSTADVLTIILLVLPQHTWSNIKENDLQEKLIRLTSTDGLPPSLQDEVLHLSQQLDFLMADLTTAAASS